LNTKLKKKTELSQAKQIQIYVQVADGLITTVKKKRTGKKDVEKLDHNGLGSYLCRRASSNVGLMSSVLYLL
jgi:hypothetical protein